MMEILVTPRLTLRPPIALDADDIAHWLSDWEVVKMMSSMPWPYLLENAEGWIARVSGPEKQIYTIHRQSLIGVVSLIGTGNLRTLGYWLGKPWHGQGFMREALTVLFDLAFSDPSVTSIDSGVVNDNPASLKLQAGLGFEVTGEMETESVPRKTQVQMITTVLTREKWLDRKIAAVSTFNPLHQQQSSQFAA